MSITPRDRDILRAIARRHMEYVFAPENERIMKQWQALAAGKRDTPTVRLLFSNFTHEVITPRMQCEGEAARKMEWRMLCALCGRELFGDDTPLMPFYDVPLYSEVQPFGIAPRMTRSVSVHNAFHIDPVIQDLADEMDRLRGGSFKTDLPGTMAEMEQAWDTFGDILPVRRVMQSLGGHITNPLVHLMGMEQYYCAMYDDPDELHQVMDMATRVYEQYYNHLEQAHLLLPMTDTAPVAQESFAFNSELPEAQALTTRDVWGFLESQETHAVSPEMYGEFVYPYQDRLARRFGLLSYGCCERVDAIWESYLSKWTHLRKLSVSPFNDEERVGEYLRGSNVVYYSKPRAEFVTNPGPLDEDALRAYFKGVCHAASGCLLEMAQREVGTLFGDADRGKRYVEIARECIAEYWKP